MGQIVNKIKKPYGIRIQKQITIVRTLTERLKIKTEDRICKKKLNPIRADPTSMKSVKGRLLKRLSFRAAIQ